MLPPSPASGWLARLRHDLVKRLLWPARDRRDMGLPGTPVRPGELVPALTDDEGIPVTALALWAALRAEAPAEIPATALDAFGTALAASVTAAERGDVDGVLALEPAIAALAQIVKAQEIR